jgi:3-hydroxybutyrate dehydrogenase
MSEPRTVLVTGGNRGIGLAIARAFGAAGARVAISGLGTDAQLADAVAAVRGTGAPDVVHLPADLRDPAAIEALWQACLAGGAPDLLVNCAGVQHTAPLAEMPADTWDLVLAVNLSAAFHLMQLALPGMAARGFGRVLNVASVNKAPYVASKFGLVGLSKVAALEYAAAGSRASGGVTINCICPGWVETPLIEPQVAARAAALGGDRDAGVRALLGEKQPSLRMSLPEDIAALATWLCRPEAHNLTGAALPVDGGWTAQ